jgi:Na+/alanine symporter
MTPLRLRQIGLVVAGLGCLFFIWGSGLILMASRSYEGASASQHRTEKVTHLIGGVLLAVGFALQLIAFYI